jgi:hypothetical protein
MATIFNMSGRFAPTGFALDGEDALVLDALPKSVAEPVLARILENNPANF